MHNLPDQMVQPQFISQAVMLAVLNRCDDTREFLVEMWRSNPQLAKQGGPTVAILLSQTPEAPGWHHELSSNT